MRSMFVFRGVMVGSLHQRPLLLEKGFITWHYRYRSITLSCRKTTLTEKCSVCPKCARFVAGLVQDDLDRSGEESRERMDSSRSFVASVQVHWSISIAIPLENHMIEEDAPNKEALQQNMTWEPSKFFILRPLMWINNLEDQRGLQSEHVSWQCHFAETSSGDFLRRASTRITSTKWAFSMDVLSTKISHITILSLHAEYAVFCDHIL